MGKKAAGIVLYRRKEGRLEFLLLHPGGPFFFKRDLGVWSIPKGEYKDEEEPFHAAKREFKEETSFDPPEGEYIELDSTRTTWGKSISAWAIEGDLDETKIKSNTFKMKLPPKIGKEYEFPEIDKGAWFALEEAKLKVTPSQLSLLEEVSQRVG